MIVLGIHDSHDCAASIFVNGKLVAAAMEERFQRTKNIGTFPLEAANFCMTEAGVSPSDIDRVAFATDKLVPNNFYSTAGSLTIQQYFRMHEEYFVPMLVHGKELKLAEVFPDYRPEGTLHYDLSKVPFATTAEITPQELTDIQQVRFSFVSERFGIDPEKIQTFPHHFCHAVHAYLFSPHWDRRTAIVTSDGGGDGIYETVHFAENGQLKEVHKGRTSLIGKIYSNVTLMLRMHPHRHAYKVMGMAPYASEFQKSPARKIFLEALTVNGLAFERNPDMKDFYSYFSDQIRLLRFDGIAGGLQDFTEIRLKEWFQNIAAATETEYFAYSGGVANNTKANFHLMNQPFVKGMSVPFGPGDEGLAIGAAAACVMESQTPLQRPGTSAALGPKVSSAVISQFEEHPYIEENYRKIDENVIPRAVDVIENGGVLAICQGGMEFGARSLGQRSLVADPSSITAKRTLNDLIKQRDFWMPFAPSVLEFCFDEYFEKPIGIESWDDCPADFMTLCYETTAKGRETLAAALHPYDFTARPQRVTKNNNKFYYKFIHSFYERTGIGAVLNTSLNIHDRPIVRDPMDIIEEILVSKNTPLEAILCENSLYVRN